MFRHTTERRRSLTQSEAGRSLRRFTFTLLLIEFLDELVFGAREAAWPLIRLDLALSYTEIGLLLSLPNICGNLIEPALGILADVWRRRALVLGGGICFAAALLLTSLSHSFPFLLAAFVLLSPASGAFVALSQATLMDAEPSRREQNMARWAFSGSLGIVVGPFALALAVMAGTGWRGTFASFFIFALMLVAVAWRSPFTTRSMSVEQAERVSLWAGARGALRALKRREVLRWLILLELADLMLDGLHGFLALYFVDVVGLTEARAGAAIVVWTCAGLPGDLLLIPLLERVRGLSYLRWSAAVSLCLFPLFLLAPGVVTKLVLLALLGFTNAGWYSILKAQLYASMPGQSGTVMTVGNLFGIFNGLIPLGLGLLAERFGLGAAMWWLLAGPLALLIGLPRRRS
jgi:FSR family fosmidomycin resistance protein-like MFS transporter